MHLRVGSAIILGLLVASCVSSPIQQLTPEQKIEAENRVSVRSSNISTVEFKELGDSKRFELVSKYVEKTWTDKCKVVKLVNDGYSRNGDSQWKTNCENTGLNFDYIVTIPEKKTSPVRVLKCFSLGPNRTECSIIPKQQPQI